MTKNLRVSRIIECSIITGFADAVDRAARSFGGPRSYAVLAHANHRHPVGGSAVSTVFTSDQTRTVAAGAQTTMVVALAAPIDRITGASLAPQLELPQTALVRASHSLLKSLSRDLPAARSAGLRALDDALISLLRGILREQPRHTAAASHDADLRDHLSWIIDEQHTDPELDVDRLARELHVSRRQLYRHADGGVAEMIARRRVQTARQLLSTRTDLSVSEIAHHAGFVSPARLRAQMLSISGQTPTEYRLRGMQADEH